MTNPWVSPLYNDLQSLAPILIQAGTAEILTDDSIRLFHRLTTAEIATNRHTGSHRLELFSDMFHGIIILNTVFQAFPVACVLRDEAFSRIAKFFTDILEYDTQTPGDVVIKETNEEDEEETNEAPDEDANASSSSSCTTSVPFQHSNKGVVGVFDVVKYTNSGVLVTRVGLDAVEKVTRGF